MILRNLDNNFMYQQINKNDTTVFGDGAINNKTIQGYLHNTTNILGYSLVDNYIMVDSNNLTRCQAYGNFLWCGSGTTPVTYDDYTTSLFNYKTLTPSPTINGVTEYNPETKKFEQTIKRTFQNISTKTITVTETLVIGCVGNSSIYYPVLLIRELLETPITVEPNGFFTITFKREVVANPLRG